MASRKTTLLAGGVWQSAETAGLSSVLRVGLVSARGEELRRGCKKLLRDVKKKLKALKKMKKDKQEEDPAQQRAYLQNISPLVVSVGDVSFLRVSPTHSSLL